MASIADLKGALSGYLTFEEVRDGGPRVVTITKAEVESVGQGDKQEDKPVLSFLESRKKLVLNKTRCGQLSEIFGPKADCVGQKVKLEAGTVKVNGRLFEMIVIGKA